MGRYFAENGVVALTEKNQVQTNFAFLAEHDELFVEIAVAAERAFSSDPNTTLIKLRQLGEALAQHIAAHVGVDFDDQTSQADLLYRLNRELKFEPVIRELFHTLRIEGNKATHRFRTKHKEAMEGLKIARALAVWFHQSFGKDGTQFKPGAFIPPTDPSNQLRGLQIEIEKLKGERYYVYIMYMATFVHWASLIGMAYVVSQYDWSWFSILGGALSAGIINGIGLVAGHEMGHKVKDRSQVNCAKIVLACSGYGHFSIEHNKGHHKDVATPEDPASSKFGESIYKFVKREIPGAFRRAWSLEAARLNRIGKSEWSMSNEILQSGSITVVAYTLMLAFWGPVMIPFLMIAAGYGWWQLTCANYVEHYGLLRLKNENGRYERCQPHHSWNSNHKASNLILLHLQRHSDHHAHPTRPYQVLRDYTDVPSLPSGYPGMYVLAMIPSAWYSVMNPKVIEWAGGDMNKVNVDPDVKVEMFRRYHQPLATNEAV